MSKHSILDQFAKLDKLLQITNELERSKILIVNERDSSLFTSSEQELISSGERLEALSELLCEYSNKLCKN